MEQKVLNAKLRNSFGKVAAKMCRAEGRTPGVMYDNKGKSIPIDVDSKDFVKLFKSITDSTIVQVKLDNNEEYQVFIKDFQYDIRRDIINHVDLYAVEPGKEINTKVGLKLEGSPVGVRNGGILETGATTIDVVCLPKDLPPKIVVNVDDLDVNQSLHVSDLNLSDAVKVLTAQDQVIATIKFAATTVVETSEESDEESVAEAPATEEVATE
ncbi:MAG: 50S ribosomal protein L25 [Treponema sp.]|nr:MAG: 50S ribosomal protein L25 [Treponema sp.]